MLPTHLLNLAFMNTNTTKMLQDWVYVMKLNTQLPMTFDVSGLWQFNGVQNHAIGVLNNVQTNYDDEFQDELSFIIVEQFVSSCAT